MVRKRTFLATAVWSRLNRAIVLALFLAGPGTGLALAIHLYAHHQKGPHSSDECQICIQLTTNAKSPTLELPTVVVSGDDLVQKVPCRSDRADVVASFSVFAPRAPPLF